MALSARERRTLRQMERQLGEEEPDLAAHLSAHSLAVLSWLFREDAASLQVKRDLRSLLV